VAHGRPDPRRILPGAGETPGGDLTAVAETDLVDKERIGKPGAAGKTVPFTATVDAQKRLTKMELALPAAGDTAAEKVSVTYSRYGAAEQLPKPSGAAQADAPESAYELLNG
jgi:hypothetical protein